MNIQNHRFENGSARRNILAPRRGESFLYLASRGVKIVRSKVLCSLAATAFVLLATGCGTKGGGLVVNSAGDAGDSDPGDEVCRTAASATECTLRAAMEEANAWAGSDTITFNLPGPSFTISTASVMPDITEAVVIDGTTQPGYIAGSNMATIDGSSIAVPITIDGLTVAPGINVTLRGFAVVEFPDDGIVNRGRLTLEDVYVGRNRSIGLASGGGSEALPLSIIDSVFISNGSAGISADRNDVTISNGAIANNHGGIGVSNGSLTMTGTQISGNSGTTLYPFGGIGLFQSRASLTAVLIDSNDSHDCGGGIEFTSDGSHVLTVTDSTISNNTAYHAGGIEINGGTVRLNHSTLIDNKARIDGGAIRVLPGSSSSTTLWVENGTVIGQPGHGNVSEFDTGDAALGRGGGIYSEARVEVSNSTIEGNSGDGIYNNGGWLRLQNSVVRSNTMNGIASISASTASSIQISGSTLQENGLRGIDARNADLLFIGGSILDNLNGGLRIESGSLDFSYSTVSGNTYVLDYGAGGGIGGYHLSTADIRNSTISGNSTLGSGGGIYLHATSGFLKNLTISGNHADVGGGLTSSGWIQANNLTVVFNTAGRWAGVINMGGLKVSNSIIAENIGGNCGGVSESISVGNNLDDGTTCGFSAAGDLSGVAPLLGLLADNGGTTFTHALLPGSPAIDAGNDATCLPLDQRNVNRPQGPHCDIGAFELIPAGATPTPTHTPEIGAPSATPTTGVTPTATPTPAPILFDSLEISSDKLFQGGQSCDPKTLTVKVRVTPPEAVASVGLFYRIVAKQGNQNYPWSEGLKMTALGNGWYALTLVGNDLPSIGQWQTEAWLDIQFVAFGPDNQPVAWSAVYRQVTFWQCYV